MKLHIDKEAFARCQRWNRSPRWQIIAAGTPQRQNATIVTMEAAR